MPPVPPPPQPQPPPAAPPLLLQVTVALCAMSSAARGVGLSRWGVPNLNNGRLQTKDMRCINCNTGPKKAIRGRGAGLQFRHVNGQMSHSAGRGTCTAPLFLPCGPLNNDTSNVELQGQDKLSQKYMWWCTLTFPPPCPSPPKGRRFPPWGGGTVHHSRPANSSITQLKIFFSAFGACDFLLISYCSWAK